MKNFLRASALLLPLFAASFAQAENLTEIYELALRNDPAIREAAANMMAEMESKPQARASLLPQLNLTSNWAKNFSDGKSVTQFGSATSISDRKTDDDSFDWTVNLSQSLFNTDAWRKLKRSDFEVAKAEVDYQAAQQDLVLRVAEAYFNVLAAQDTLLSERATRDSIARQLEQAERRFEVGLIAITDVKESQAAYDDSVALEIAARRSLANSKEALREITGEYPQTLATTGQEFPLIPPNPQVEQDWVDVSLQQNAALESAKIATEISRENVRIARAGHAPTLSLNARYGGAQSDGTTTNNPPNPLSPGDVGYRADYLDPSPTEGDRTSGSIGIGFTLPIYSGGGTSSVVQENVYRHRATREAYERTARETERESRDAYLGVIAEIARVRALARSVESNQTALEATEAGYDVGTRTTVDVLNSKESLFRARTQYARSKYDYLINVFKLKKAAGTLTATDVAELNEWLVESGELDEIPGRGGSPDVQMQDSTISSDPTSANP